MPLAITLGFRAKGRTAVPEVLYCGLSGAEADRLSFNPPPGIIRTELIKHPLVQRRRFFPCIVEAATTVPVVDEAAAVVWHGPEIDAPPGSVETEKAEATTDSVVEESAPEAAGEAADLPLPDASNRNTRRPR